MHFHNMKVYKGVEGKLQTFFTSALDKGECSASCSGGFTPLLSDSPAAASMTWYHYLQPKASQ
jgi:hypothetical protein